MCVDRRVILESGISRGGGDGWCFTGVFVWALIVCQWPGDGIDGGFSDPISSGVTIWKSSTQSSESLASRSLDVVRFL